MTKQREEYTALRAEILQSIAQQHHILLGGYGASAAAVGLLFGGSSSNIGMEALFVIPLILTSMVALWAVECNRMVRASYYIGKYLWDQIPDENGNSELGWESWIRLEGGCAGNFRRRQDLMQKIVTLWLPVGLTATGFAISLIHSWEKPLLFGPIIPLAILVGCVWYHLLKEIPRISDLAKEQDKPASNQTIQRSGGGNISENGESTPAAG